MEAVLLHDQSLSPCNYKQKKTFRNSKKNNRPFISRHPSENLAPPNFDLHTPLSYSFPPSLALNLNPHHLHQQPPLLPLPFSKPNYNTTTNYYSRSRGLSCPPINRKVNNRIRNQSLAPKKSKPSTICPGPNKEEIQKPEILKSTTITSSESLIIASTNRMGPDPNDLPKDVSRVLSVSSSSGSNNANNSFSSSTLTAEDELDRFSGTGVFTLSPPPSSLPLPTFSLRPKLSCKAEAAGIDADAGATDSLRRLLRLR